MPDLHEAPAVPTAVLPAQPALACRRLTVAYGARHVLGAVSLDFATGQWSAVVGPNGCGKSTLLRALAGLVVPHSGSIELHGRNLSSWSRRLPCAAAGLAVAIDGGHRSDRR